MVNTITPTHKMAPSFRFVIVLLLCSCSVATGLLSGGHNMVPTVKYQVDLDRMPKERWIPILEDLKGSVPLILQYYETIVPSAIEREVLDEILSNLDRFLGELGEEMRGISEYWGLDLGIVVGLNFAYELRRMEGGRNNITNGTVPDPPADGQSYVPSACTSIVAQDTNGVVHHGRNLDWNLPNYLRNLTVQADFIKGGEVVFTGVVTAGFVGVATGMSPAGFSISINERELGGEPVVDLLEAVLRKAASPTHLVRNVLLTADSYDTSLHLLSKEVVTAPVYYITAGTQPGQGAVLTRDRDSLRDLWALNTTTTPPNKWYLLETNYDHWEPTYKYDNRRYYGNMYMHEAGQKKAATMDGLLEVLTKDPIQNRFTSITVVMCPKSQEIQSFDVYTDQSHDECSGVDGQCTV